MTGINKSGINKSPSQKLLRSYNSQIISDQDAENFKMNSMVQVLKKNIQEQKSNMELPSWGSGMVKTREQKLKQK